MFDTTDDDQPRALHAGLAIGAAIAFLAATLFGLLAPSAVVGSSMPGMPMTHYMELLSVRSPWNLLIFMALPVVLAETLAITELVVLLGRAPRWVRGLSRVAGLVAGPVMLGILVHLLRYAVMPLTLDGGWRGAADVIAVVAYLLGTIPLVAITLVEVGLLGSTPRRARVWHVAAVAVFLVVAHIAMIFGMLDPSVMGWDAPTAGHQHGGAVAPSASPSR